MLQNNVYSAVATFAYWNSQSNVNVSLSLWMKINQIYHYFIKQTHAKLVRTSYQVVRTRVCFLQYTHVKHKREFAYFITYSCRWQDRGHT